MAENKRSDKRWRQDTFTSLQMFLFIYLFNRQTSYTKSFAFPFFAGSYLVIDFNVPSPARGHFKTRFFAISGSNDGGFFLACEDFGVSLTIHSPSAILLLVLIFVSGHHLAHTESTF